MTFPAGARLLAQLPVDNAFADIPVVVIAGEQTTEEQASGVHVVRDVEPEFAHTSWKNQRVDQRFIWVKWRWWS